MQADIVMAPNSVSTASLLAYLRDIGRRRSRKRLFSAPTRRHVARDRCAHTGRDKSSAEQSAGYSASSSYRQIAALQTMTRIEGVGTDGGASLIGRHQILYSRAHVEPAKAVGGVM